MRPLTRLVTLIALFAFAAAGCADAPPVEDAGHGTAADETPAAGKADMWGPQDDPELFSQELEYRLAELPEDGEAASIPWAANYWPVYQDSINHPWAGEGTQSPAAKWGEAFGIPDLEDRISRLYGIDAHETRTECEDDDACNKDIGEKCAKRTGADKGRCIPSWWGICHAWAPVAILEAEPVHPVTINGVTFNVNDLKAIITLLFDKTEVKFLSKRCDADESSEESITVDEYGNPTGEHAACKDTNPGTLHTVVANLVGLQAVSFVEDRTYDDEVWNQPLSGYRITKQEEVTAQQANELLGVKPSVGEGGLSEKVDGNVDQGAWFQGGEFTIPAGGHVTVTMSGKNDPDLYVRLGAAPTLEEYDCRPWAAGADEECKLDPVAAETQVFVAVYGYDTSEEFSLQIDVVSAGGGVPETYVFNDQAKQLFRMQMKLDYIGESPAHVDGNLASQIQKYTYTDTYDYVLELDADGKIIGGEWMGASKKAHPDFLWLPLSRKKAPTAEGAISYTAAKILLDQSISGAPGNLEPAMQFETVDLPKKTWKHFGPFEVAGDGIEVSTTGTGDADLYVRRGAQPTGSKFDCRPYLNGSKEHCEVQGTGTYYVSVYGYAAADIELFVSFAREIVGAEPPVEEPPVEEPPTVTHLDVNGTVAKGEMKLFTLEVTAGETVKVRTFADGDVDLYVKFGQAPTTVSYDHRAYTWSGNETVTYTPSADGTLHIGVHGYDASDFNLKTSAE